MSTPTTSDPTTSDPAGRSIDGWLVEHGDDLIAFRRHLHAHPELSGQEHATTEMVTERLELAGLKPRRLASGTGLICDVHGDHVDGPRLALRADLDALGMHDEKDVPYRSQVPGVTHACGHDAHTTIMLGTALYYARHLDELPGRVRFVFQPAEERVPGGALDVLADDGLADVAAIVGYHCDPKLDVGSVALKSGPISSAADMAHITLTGPGGHTARPEQTVDMITLAARIVAELPVRLAAAVGGADRVKCVFGAIHAGDAANVIPSSCEIKASVRTPYLEVWEELPDLFGRQLTELLAESGAGFELHYTHGVPPVVNDGAVTEVVRRAASGEIGAEAVVPAVQSWGGDDYAWFTREVPGTYVRLGVHDPDGGGPKLDLHAGRFDLDERAIAIGVKVAVAIVGEYFASPDGRGE